MTIKGHLCNSSDIENQINSLKIKIRRWTLILGVMQIFFGCLVGLIPSSEVLWFRGIVMSHLQYTSNGMLMILFGLLVPELCLSARALKVWFVTLQIGTWSNGTAGLVGAIIGFSSKLMPTLNEKFPAPRGLDHPAVSGLLHLCGVMILISLSLTLYGFFAHNKKT